MPETLKKGKGTYKVNNAFHIDKEFLFMCLEWFWSVLPDIHAVWSIN